MITKSISQYVGVFDVARGRSERRLEVLFKHMEMPKYPFGEVTYSEFKKLMQSNPEKKVYNISWHRITPDIAAVRFSILFPFCTEKEAEKELRRIFLITKSEKIDLVTQEIPQGYKLGQQKISFQFRETENVEEAIQELEKLLK